MPVSMPSISPPRLQVPLRNHLGNIPKHSGTHNASRPTMTQTCPDPLRSPPSPNRNTLDASLRAYMINSHTNSSTMCVDDRILSS